MTEQTAEPTNDYFAALIDGEGSISIIRNYERLRLSVQVSMKDPVLLQFLKTRFGGSLSEQANGENRRIWHYQVTAGKAAALLQAVLPYLRLKRPQAMVGLSFQSGVFNAGPKETSQVELERRVKHKLIIERLNNGEKVS